MQFHPFKAAFLFGVLMMITAVVLQLLNPVAAGVLPPGFRTPIIALEFALNGEEVRQMFDTPDAFSLRNNFLLGNAVDYFFMFFYSAFLGLTGAGIARETGQRILWLTLALSTVVCFSDLLENFTIASILQAHFSGRELSAGYFGNLRFFTWLKWGGIVTCLLIFGAWFWNRNVFGRVIAIVSFVTFGLAIGAYFYRSILNEFMALGVVLSFLLLFVHHGWFFWRSGVEAKGH